MIPLDHQIAEVKRELAMRSRVFPGLVARGKMRQGEADQHTERLQAVLKTLEWLQLNRSAVVDAVTACVDQPVPL